MNCEGSHPAYPSACTTLNREKSIVTLKVYENISFREARQRLSLTECRSYSVVLQLGVTTQRSAAPVLGTPRDAGAGHPAPTVDAAPVAPLPQTLAVRTPGSASLKGPLHAARLNVKTFVQLGRLSIASGDAMDTSQGSPGPPMSERQWDSLDRIKDKLRITGPEDKTWVFTLPIK